MTDALADLRPEPICGMNTWMPVPARIVEVREENFNTRTFTLRFAEDEIRRAYRFVPGQFNMLYAPGVGEAAISISSNPAETDTLDHTIRVVGRVTRGLAQLQARDRLGMRGPYVLGAVGMLSAALIAARLAPLREE